MADIKIYGKLVANTEDQVVADASSIQDTTKNQKLNVTLAGKQDLLTPGNGISIENNVISSSVDTSDKLDKDESQTTYNQAYTKNANGTQSMLNIVSNANASNSIVQRNNSGHVVVGTGQNDIFLDNEAVTKKYVSDEISNALSSVYKFIGTLTVAQINALSTSSLSVGDVYNVSDSGTITLGSLSVIAGDNVAWTGTDWDKMSGIIDLSNYYTSSEVDTLLNGKQATLVSGTNIKKINNATVLGSGNIDLQVPLVGSGTGQNIKTINSNSILGSGNISVQPTLVSGNNIKTINNQSLLGSGNITISGGSEIVNKTYAELVSMVNGGTLEKGTYYRITDYVTTCNGVYDLSSIGQQGAYLPYATSAEHPFDLIVLAVENNKLDEHAIAVQHSGDTYFANSNLLAWDIKYTIENDNTKYSWADPVNGKGVITFMRDEFGNEAYYDFKNIMNLQFALKQVASNTVLGSDFVYNSTYQPNRYGNLYDVFANLTNMPIDTGNLTFDVQDIQGVSAIKLIVFITDVRKSTLDSPMNWTYMLMGLSQMMGTTVDLATLAYLLGTTEQVLSAMTERQVIQQFFNADFYYTFNFIDVDYPTTKVDMSTNMGGLCYSNIIGHSSDALTSLLYNMQGGVVVIPNGLNVISFENNNYAKENLESNQYRCYANKVGNSSFLAVFGTNSYLNEIGGECVNTRIGDNTTYNIIGNRVNLCSIGLSCTYNVITSSQHVRISHNSSDNVIRGCMGSGGLNIINCYSNNITRTVNTTLTDCSRNIIIGVTDSTFTSSGFNEISESSLSSFTNSSYNTVLYSQTTTFTYCSHSSIRSITGSQLNDMQYSSIVGCNSIQVEKIRYCDFLGVEHITMLANLTDDRYLYYQNISIKPGNKYITIEPTSTSIATSNRSYYIRNIIIYPGYSPTDNVTTLQMEASTNSNPDYTLREYKPSDAIEHVG